MRAVTVLGLLAGLLLVTLLVLSRGVDAIWHSATLLGFSGLAAIIAFHLAVIALMGGAWYLLAAGRPDASFFRFVWGRLIRDSAAEALPLSQVGGFVLGARALALTGVSGSFAAASTVVDVTLELIAQLAYTVIGLALLRILHPGSEFAIPVLIGLLVMTVLAGCFLAVQARGAGFVERAGAALIRQFLGRRGAAGGVQDGIRALHARPARLAWATLVHLATWVLSGVETWLTFRLMSVPVSLPEALVIDSLLYAMRSVAFMVPNALGVQEGAMLLLGALFGVTAPAALAFSFIRRARDLVTAVPTLLAWQAVEGRRVWRHNANGVAAIGREAS